MICLLCLPMVDPFGRDIDVHNGDTPVHGADNVIIPGEYIWSFEQIWTSNGMQIFQEHNWLLNWNSFDRRTEMEVLNKN